MKRFLTGVLCLGLLAGCGTVQRINPFARAVPEQALPFQARISTTRGSPDFSVAVAAGGAPITAWRESARYQGTQFCMRRFGSSEIDWQRQPGGDWAQARSEDGRVVVRGRCDAR